MSLIVDQFQKVHVGQGMWPLEQTADNFVQEDQDTSDETDGDIAEDTLDCNVDDRISSPPVCWLVSASFAFVDLFFIIYVIPMYCWYCTPLRTLFPGMRSHLFICNSDKNA